MVIRGAETRVAPFSPPVDIVTIWTGDAHFTPLGTRTTTTSAALAELMAAKTLPRAALCFPVVASAAPTLILIPAFAAPSKSLCAASNTPSTKTTVAHASSTRVPLASALAPSFGPTSVAAVNALKSVNRYSSARFVGARADRSATTSSVFASVPGRVVAVAARPTKPSSYAAASVASVAAAAHRAPRAVALRLARASLRDVRAHRATFARPRSRASSSPSRVARARFVRARRGNPSLALRRRLRAAFATPATAPSRALASRARARNSRPRRALPTRVRSLDVARRALPRVVPLDAAFIHSAAARATPVTRRRASMDDATTARTTRGFSPSRAARARGRTTRARARTPSPRRGR